MHRRGFLKGLVAAATGSVLAPVLKLLPHPAEAFAPSVERALGGLRRQGDARMRFTRKRITGRSYTMIVSDDLLPPVREISPAEIRTLEALIETYIGAPKGCEMEIVSIGHRGLRAERSLR